MNEKQGSSLLHHLEEQRIPETTDLWPAIEAKLANQPLAAVRRRMWLRNSLLAAVVFSSASFIFYESFIREETIPVKSLTGIQETIPAPKSISTSSAQAPFGSAFIVYQPNFLPGGFALSESDCHLCPAGILFVQPAQLSQTGGQIVVMTPAFLTATQQILNPDQVSFYEKYTGPDGQYFTLLERKAKLNELQPTATQISVNGMQTQIESLDGNIKLTWTTSGTWISVEGNLSKEDMLRIAESMIEIQTINPKLNPRTSP